MRPCIEPQCPQLTQRTRCAKHEAERQRHRDRIRPGYGGQYQANRAKVLAGDPPCYYPGCPTPGTTADHIVPIKDGGGHEVGNLRPSCVKHNSGRR